MKIFNNLLRYTLLYGVVYILSLSFNMLHAQDLVFYRIRVKDRTDQSPVAGATITNVTLQNSSSTSSDGIGEIQGKQGDEVRISVVGYTDLVVHLGSSTSVDALLERDQKSVGEVVVTALGIKRETRGLTYATQQLSGSAVSDVRDNSGNIMTSLNGKVAGAVVTTASTGPGAAARVVLRGNKSISGNNNALVVVDGVPYDNSQGTQATGTTPNYGSSDGAANINPDDIESINVLKGPSAAALYGSRAANGVIIITTKQGSADRYRIDYNGGFSIDQVNMLTKFQNTYGRGSGGNLGTNVGESWGAPGTTYSDNVRSVFDNASTINNSISTYGGTEKLNGYVSYANSRIGGIFPGNQLGRNNLNLRINSEPLPKLKTDVKLNYVNQQIDNRPRLGDMGIPVEAYIMPRDLSKEELNHFEDINPSNGEPVRKYWSGATLYDNPLWSLNRTSVNEERDRITALASASYELANWLSVMGRYSFDRYNDKTDGSFYQGTMSLGDVRRGGKYYETHNNYWERNIDLLLSGSTALSDDILLTYNAGTSFLTRQRHSFQNMANGLSIPNKFSMSMATTPEFLLINRYKRQLNSVYASAQVGFYENIFLDLTARNDWSSTLGSPHSYFYPSAGLSVVFHDYLKLPDWVQFAKARASYAFVGNDAEPYLLQQLYNFGLGAGQGFVFRNSVKAIENLKPEQTRSFEAGLDVKFLSGRLSLDATYYKSNTKNQLIFLNLPMASGFSREYINAGNIQNEGWEVQLSAKPVDNGRFSWNTGLNFSRNVNTVLELHEKRKREDISASTNYAMVVVAEGERYGDLYGQKWKVDEATGKYVVNSSGLPVAEQNKHLGNFNPDALLGWNNTFSYKKFSLSTLVDARIGGEIVSGTAAYLAAYGVGDFTEMYREGGWVIDAVDENGNANQQAITAQQFWTTVSAGGRNAWGEFFTYDMTNVRLRELALSYRFDVSRIKGITAAQISLTGRNLFFFYRGKSKLDIPGLGKIKNPIDPEGALGTGNYQGIEVGLPPAVRTYGLNLKLTF